MQTLLIASDSETLRADLYGELPARRAAILVHGAGWDASGWRDVAPRFTARGVPALALNLRGYDGSTGATNAKMTIPDWTPPPSWSPVADLRAAKRALRDQGVSEVALVGASMGGHAVLMSSVEADVECVVSISAPVVDIPEELSRKISGRKLFVSPTRMATATSCRTCCAPSGSPRIPRLCWSSVAASTRARCSPHRTATTR